jgi:hypothetical protein
VDKLRNCEIMRENYTGQEKTRNANSWRILIAKDYTAGLCSECIVDFIMSNYQAFNVDCNLSPQCPLLERYS